MDTLVIVGFLVLGLFGFMSWQTAIGSIGMFIVIFGFVLPLGFAAVFAVFSFIARK